MKKLLCLIFTILILSSLTACSVQLSDYLIIKGIGIDYSDEQYTVTVRYVDTNEETSEKNYTSQGTTVYDALNQLSLISGKIPLYSAADYIIYSEEVAEKGLDEALDFFVRYFKAKANISLYICENTASEILEFKKDDQLISSDYILESTQNRDTVGKTVNATVLDYVSYMENESMAILVPYLFIKDEEIFGTRSAVFSDYKLKYIFDETDTKAYLAAKGQLTGTSEVIKLSTGELITIEISETSSNFDGEIIDGSLNFTLCVDVQTAVVSMPISLQNIDYDELEQKLEEKIENEIKSCLSTDNLLEADFFGISNYIYRNYWKEWANSDESLENFDDGSLVEITVNIDFIKTGEEDNPFYS